MIERYILDRSIELSNNYSAERKIFLKEKAYQIFKILDIDNVDDAVKKAAIVLRIVAALESIEQIFANQVTTKEKEDITEIFNEYYEKVQKYIGQCGQTPGA